MLAEPVVEPLWLDELEDDGLLPCELDESVALPETLELLLERFRWELPLADVERSVLSEPEVLIEVLL